MKISVLLRIARQFTPKVDDIVAGGVVLINAVKVSTRKEVLSQYMQDNPMDSRQTIEGVDCFCEWGILEDLEIDS